MLNYQKVSEYYEHDHTLNNLKTEANRVDFGQLKFVSKDLKKLSDLVDNEVVQNAKFSIPKTKENDLKKTITEETTLIHVNQYNADKQNLEKEVQDFD